MNILITAGIILAAIIIFIVFLCSIYRVADVDKALIITGGKEPKIKVSGGSFVIPIFRKASFFDLCMLTVKTSRDIIGTKTAVSIIIDWTAQIRPVTSDLDVLQKAIISFKERGQDGIISDVKQTIMGAVRAVVANLTPEEVRIDQEKFKQSIRDSISDELKDMGLELVSLNIQDITDDQGYYENIAAIDREEKRREAEKTRAIADQHVREQKAASERIAKESELDTELQIAEKSKNNALKKAAFKIETDKANADAAIAGRLQETIREREVAEQEGQVEVVRQEQANFAALKEKEVIKTRAESRKVQAEIKAAEDAAIAVISAEGEAKVAEQDAKIAEINAEATAKVLEREARGKANAVRTEAEANANKVRLEGETEAEVISKKGLAEAEAIKAKKLAEAEGEKALAEARAGNDKVNFEIEKIKLETQAKVEIATKTATIMAELGKNAQFIDLGGSNTGGNMLIDTLSQIPSLMKSLDVQNQALNGAPVQDTIKNLVSGLADPLKGILGSSIPTIEE